MDARIDYSAEDSLTFFLDNKDVFLYNKAKIDYDKMKLESGFMTVNFDIKESPFHPCSLRIKTVK